MPSKNNMKKNNAEKKGARGIMLRARGYATNAKPGPTNIIQCYNIHCL